MPLINVILYWILWSIFVLYYKYPMFYFLQKLCVPLYKINPPYNTTPLWNQNFMICQNIFFTKIFFPDFVRWGADVMTFPNQLAPKQIAIFKTGQYDCRILQKPLSKHYLNNLRLGILGNKKLLEKSQIGWRQILVTSLPSRNIYLVIAVKNYTL